MKGDHRQQPIYFSYQQQSAPNQVAIYSSGYNMMGKLNNTMGSTAGPKSSSSAVHQSARSSICSGRNNKNSGTR